MKYIRRPVMVCDKRLNELLTITRRRDGEKGYSKARILDAGFWILVTSIENPESRIYYILYIYNTMLIVATEIQVRNFWRFFEFVSLSVRSAKQAKKTAGNIHTHLGNKAWRIGYTLTVWENKEAMQVFRNSGAHKKAMTKIRKLSSQYKTLVWEADDIPLWKDAKAHLDEMAFKVLK